jgi:hypothetical protein
MPQTATRAQRARHELVEYLHHSAGSRAVQLAHSGNERRGNTSRHQTHDAGVPHQKARACAEAVNSEFSDFLRIFGESGRVEMSGLAPDFSYLTDLLDISNQASGERALARFLRSRAANLFVPEWTTPEGIEP